MVTSIRRQAVRRDRPTQPFELMLGRAELVLDLNRPEEVAMQRVVDIDTDTAV